jgi:hypothetical protein
MPPSAQPHGDSRADMTGLLALFTTSGNQQQHSPDTPLQILYTDPDSVTFGYQTRDGDLCKGPSET